MLSRACATVVLLGSILATAACGGSAGAEASPPPLGALHPVRSEAALVLPLDHYLPTPRERAVLATARSELTSQCMARFGFAGYPVDSYAAQADVPVHGNTFGVFDESIANTYGYKAEFESELLAQSDDIAVRFANWGAPGVTAVLEGSAALPTSVAARGGQLARPDVPSGGCAAEGPRALYAMVGAPVPPELGWIDTLQGTAFGAATEDARLKPTVAAWSRCMKAAGYDYASPSDANDDPAWSGRRDGAQAKRVAVVDVHCKWSSGYIDTYVALAAAYESQLVEQNAERLQDALDTRKKLLAAAAAHGLGRIRAVGAD